jgi:predicted transcriptional regulator
MMSSKSTGRKSVSPSVTRLLYTNHAKYYGAISRPTIYCPRWIAGKKYMAEDVLGLTAQIVSAHVTKNSVSVEELPGLIREVYKTLANVGEVAAPVEAAKPAVAVTKSVFPDYIVCLEDGKQMTMLKRHLMTEHNLTVDQYRAKWGLPSSYPMVAPNYAETRSTLAKKMGLGRSRTVVAPPKKPGRKPGRKAGARG